MPCSPRGRADSFHQQAPPIKHNGAKAVGGGHQATQSCHMTDRGTLATIGQMRWLMTPTMKAAATELYSMKHIKLRWFFFIICVVNNPVESL